MMSTIRFFVLFLREEKLETAIASLCKMTSGDGAGSRDHFELMFCMVIQLAEAASRRSYHCVPSDDKSYLTDD